MKNKDINIIREEKDKPSETIYFEHVYKDTHGAYDKTKNTYTIVKSGFYMVKKYYNAGDIIESPEMVGSV